MTGLPGLCSSAYIVHDLQAIALFEARLLPLILVDNFPVQFDRNPIRFHPEFLNQSGQRFSCKLALIAVDDQIHLESFSPPEGRRGKWG